MKKLIYISLLLISSLDIFGQNPLNNSEDRRYFIGTTISSGLISGIQSCIINKPKYQSFGKTFLKGFYKGCIGGSIQYTSKKILQYGAEKNSFNYIWPARITNDIGNSIVLNSSQNKPLLSTLYLKLYFANISYEFKTKKIGYQLDVISLGGSIYSLCKGYNFDTKYSLQTGSMYFQRNMKDTIYEGNYLEAGVLGKSIGNCLIINKYIKAHYYDFYYIGDNPISECYESIKNYKVQVTIHELVHEFQYNQFNSLNLISTDRVFKLLNINIININLNFPILYSLNNFNYQNNYFENEANYFGNSNISSSINWH
jgi:hypothetical protein